MPGTYCTQHAVLSTEQSSIYASPHPRYSHALEPALNSVSSSQDISRTSRIVSQVGTSTKNKSQRNQQLA